MNITNVMLSARVKCKSILRLQHKETEKNIQGDRVKKF